MALTFLRLTFFLRLVEACVAERLTPRTPDLEVRGSSLARRIVSLGKEPYSTLSLFTQVYKWVPATYCWVVPCDGLASRPGGSHNTRVYLYHFYLLITTND